MTYPPEYRRMLNRMGYYHYQNGLIHRHMDQGGGWDGHLGRCRHYILDAIERIKPEKVTILGSGWLLDLPLPEILERTSGVVLVDIIHPPDVVRQTSKIGNVELIEADITGGLVKEVWNKAGNSFFKKISSLSTISIPEFTPAFDPGLVISLNILTQLETLPVEYLKKKTTAMDKEISLFRTEVQRKHLSFLGRFRSVLVSDVEEIYTENSGKIRTEPTLRTLLPEGSHREEWTWNFDLKGGDYYNTRSVMKVVALTLNS